MPIRKVHRETTSPLKVHTHLYDTTLRRIEIQQVAGHAYIPLEWQLRMHGARSRSAGHQKYLKNRDQSLRAGTLQNDERVFSSESDSSWPERIRAIRPRSRSLRVRSSTSRRKSSSIWSAST